MFLRRAGLSATAGLSCFREFRTKNWTRAKFWQFWNELLQTYNSAKSTTFRFMCVKSVIWKFTGDLRLHRYVTILNICVRLFATIVHWRELGEVENECTSYTFRMFAIFELKLFWHQKTRIVKLPEGEEITTFWHNTGVWRTDRRTERQTRCCRKDPR